MGVEIDYANIKIISRNRLKGLKYMCEARIFILDLHERQKSNMYESNKRPVGNVVRTDEVLDQGLKNASAGLVMHSKVTHKKEKVYEHESALVGK